MTPQLKLTKRVLLLFAAILGGGLTVVTGLLLAGLVVLANPRVAQHLAGALPQVANWATGADVAVGGTATNWNAGTRRLELRWQDVTAVFPDGRGKLSATVMAVELSYGWDQRHFVTLHRLRLDNPVATLPEPAGRPAGEPVLRPVLAALEHLSWPFAFVEELEIKQGTVAIGADRFVADVNVHFAPDPATGRPVLQGSGQWQQGSIRLPVQVQAVALERGQVDVRAVTGAVQWPTAAFEGGKLDIAGAQAHLLLDPRNRRVAVNALHVLTLGLPLEGKADIVWDEQVVAVRFAARAQQVKMPQLRQLWPLSAAPVTRGWVMGRLSEGTAKDATVQGRLAVPVDDPEQTQVSLLQGRLDLAGFTVRYLDNMPPVTGLDAVADYDWHQFKLTAKAAESEGVDITGGTVWLGDKAPGHPVADLDLKFSGPLMGQLKVVTSVPAMARAWQPDLAKVSGTADTHLKMSIPLEKPVDTHLTVDGSATLKDAALPLPDGRMVSGANGKLTATLEQVAVDFTGRFDGLPAMVSWTQPFAKDKNWTATLRSTAPARDWGGLLKFDLAPYLDGPLDVTANASGKGEIAAVINAGAATMAVPQARWQKPAGQPATLTLNIRPGELSAVTFNAGDDRLAARVLFSEGQEIEQMFIDGLQWGRTRLTGEVKMEKGIHLATVTAEALDLSGLLEDDGRPSSTSMGERGWAKMPPMRVEGRIGQLWLGKDQPALKDNELGLEAGQQGLERATLKGTLPEGEPYTLSIFPPEGGGRDRALRIETANAGGLLRGLDLYPNIKGGNLLMTARLMHRGPLLADGKVEIRDFRLEKAPLLARLLSLASLTGPLDILTGQGMGFRALTADWSLSIEETLTLKKGLMAGGSIGLQAEGTVDLANRQLDLNGAILPIYMLTDVVEEIPLLGNLLTNNRKEGLIAMRFSVRGPQDAPQVAVNPLTALTPGFLRGFFDIFK